MLGVLVGAARACSLVAMAPSLQSQALENRIVLDMGRTETASRSAQRIIRLDQIATPVLTPRLQWYNWPFGWDWLANDKVFAALLDMEDPAKFDIAYVDIRTGQETLLPRVREVLRGATSWKISPDGQWLVWYDEKSKTGRGMRITGEDHFTWGAGVDLSRFALYGYHWTSDSRRWWMDKTSTDMKEIILQFDRTRLHSHVTRTLQLENNSAVPKWILDDVPGIFARGAINARDQLVLQYPEWLRKYYGHHPETSFALIDLKQEQPVWQEVVMKGIPDDVDMVDVTLSPQGNKAAWMMRLAPAHRSQDIALHFWRFGKPFPRVWALYVSDPLVSMPQFKAYMLGGDERLTVTWRSDEAAIHIIGATTPTVPWIVKLR